MKKVIIYTLLFVYMGSALKPFAPVIFDYISKTFWEISHQKHVKDMGGRVSILNELADMAKHNNPKSRHAPKQELKLVSASSYAVPEIHYSFAMNPFSETHFSHYSSSAVSVFGQITVPPPKAA